jgi:hypothetical protein
LDIQVIIQNSNTGLVFDISTLCSSIQYETFLKSQPGKCTMLIQKDPNEILQISNGSKINITVDGVGIFFGYVFTLGTDATETYKLLAYDSLRYLKSEEVYVTRDMSSSEIFSMVCTEASLPFKVSQSTSYVCPTYLHDKKSRYTIIEWANQLSLINENLYCFIRDDFGVINYTELQQEKTDIVIGDASLLTDYQYEISIDDDTYNEVKVVRENESTGKRDVWIVEDSGNKKRWGNLRLLVEAPKELNEAQIVELANNTLKLKNRETKTMKLNAIGDKRIKVGSGFILKLEKLNLMEYMWVTNITHSYTKDFHFMTMEVFIGG